MNLPLEVSERIKVIALRLQPVAERIDRLSLRERGLLFAAVTVVFYMAWQSLLMDPLALRARVVEGRLESARQKAETEALSGTEADQDPAVQAMTRERALRERLATLDSQLAEASQGYVSPERMALLLRALFAGQRGLRLVSLRNLPVENLSPPEAADRAGRPADAAAASGQGPYLHPVEIVLEGDYASVVGYLRDLERLPWRLHWRKLDISTLQYPNNRVRIEIGTLSLSRDWMAV